MPLLTGFNKYMQTVKACQGLGILHLFQVWRISPSGLQIPFPLNILLHSFLSLPFSPNSSLLIPGLYCPCLPSWKKTNKQITDSFNLCLSNTNLTAFICDFELFLSCFCLLTNRKAALSAYLQVIQAVLHASSQKIFCGWLEYQDLNLMLNLNHPSELDSINSCLCFIQEQTHSRFFLFL